MGNTRIQELLEKQDGKCAECQEPLTTIESEQPDPTKLLCSNCIERLSEEKISTQNSGNWVTVPSPYLNIRQWASEYTAERANESDDFCWTPAMRKLVRSLLTLKSQFIALKGLQGVGKTRFCEELYWTLREQLGNEETSVFMFKLGAFNALYYANYIRNEIIRMLKIRLPRAEWKNLYEPDPYTVTDYDEANIDFVCYNRYQEKHPKKFKALVEELVLYEMSLAPVLVDMPDYDKNHVSQFVKDLQAIGALWAKLGNIAKENGEPAGNFLFFIQAELYQKVRHFIFGKPKIVDLKPIKPEVIAEWYCQKFGSSKPFNKEALLLVAKLSRGIWRRFKRYVETCLDNVVDLQDANSYQVTTKNVNEWITNDQLINDMELELCDIFHDRMKRKHAVMVIRLLLERKEVPQTEIAQTVFDDYTAEKKACSKLLSKLEAHDFITRRREGKEKIVCWRGE